MIKQKRVSEGLNIREKGEERVGEKPEGTEKKVKIKEERGVRVKKKKRK